MMNTLESWIVILWGVGGISYLCIQAYRLQKWKEDNE